MIKVCPVVDFQINAKVARLNALFTLIIVLTSVFIYEKWFLFILTLDFFSRAFLKGKYSIISFISKSILKLFKIEPKLINAGPKMFAARLAFLLCSLILISYLINLTFVAQIISFLMVVLSSLEFFFDICMGCKTYSLLQKLGF